MSDFTIGKSLGLKTIRGRPLKIKDIAPLIGYSERWIRNAMENGTFPIRYYPIGQRSRIVDSVDLDEWLSKISVKP